MMSEIQSESVLSRGLNFVLKQITKIKIKIKKH